MYNCGQVLQVSLHGCCAVPHQIGDLRAMSMAAALQHPLVQHQMHGGIPVPVQIYGIFQGPATGLSDSYHLQQVLFI